MRSSLWAEAHNGEDRGALGLGRCWARACGQRGEKWENCALLGVFLACMDEAEGDGDRDLHRRVGKTMAGDQRVGDDRIRSVGSRRRRIQRN